MTEWNPANVPCVYVIRFSGSDKVYVGKARKGHARWVSHKSALRLGKHRNRHLQAAWDKHGAECFSWEIAERITGNSVEEIEAALCEAEVRILRLHPNNYNLMRAGEPSMIASDETRAKLSAERKVRWADPEYKARVSASIKASHQDPEFSARRGASISKGQSTPELKALRASILKANWADGGVLRETQGKVMRDAWSRGDYREKQAASRKATWADPEVRAKRVAGLVASHARRKAAKAETALTARDLFGD